MTSYKKMKEGKVRAKGTPDILGRGYEIRDWVLMGFDVKGEDTGEIRKVTGYEDDEGWHGRLTAEKEPALMMCWPKGCWRNQDG